MSTKSISETNLPAISAPLEDSFPASYHNNYVERAGKLGFCLAAHLLVYKDSSLPARVAKMAHFAIASVGFAMYDVVCNLWAKVTGHEVTPVVTAPSNNPPAPITQPSKPQDKPKPEAKTKTSKACATTNVNPTKNKAKIPPSASNASERELSARIAATSKRVQDMLSKLSGSPPPSAPPQSNAKIPELRSQPKSFDQLLRALPHSALTYENSEDLYHGDIVGPNIPPSVNFTDITQEHCEQLERNLLALYGVLRVVGVTEGFTIQNSALFINGQEIYNAQTPILEKDYRLKSIKNWWILLIKAFKSVNTYVQVQNRHTFMQDLLALSLKPGNSSTWKLEAIFPSELGEHINGLEEEAKRLIGTINTQEALACLENKPFEELDKLDFYPAVIQHLKGLSSSMSLSRG